VTDSQQIHSLTRLGRYLEAPARFRLSYMISNYCQYVADIVIRCPEVSIDNCKYASCSCVRGRQDQCRNQPPRISTIPHMVEEKARTKTTITAPERSDNQIDSSDRVLQERVPKVGKMRRKKSSPEVSPVVETAKDNHKNTKQSIHLQIPENPSTPLPAHLTQMNLDFSLPGFPSYGDGPEY